jgi:outer membrane usher protein FimD/PapC
MGLKGNFEQDDETVAFSSGAAEIVVADAALRVIYFNVSISTLNAFLVPGVYLYDFIMTDDTTGVRTQLMHGEFQFAEAVSKGP